MRESKPLLLVKSVTTYHNATVGCFLLGLVCGEGLLGVSVELCSVLFSPFASIEITQFSLVLVKWALLTAFLMFLPHLVMTITVLNINGFDFA